MDMRKLALAVRLVIAGSVIGLTSAHAGPLALSEVPLTVSATIDPNVMLLVDNSGSMEAIIWHDDFDPEGSYGSWQYRNGNNWSNVNNATDYTPSNLGRDSCSSNYSRFRRSTGGGSYEYKCLRLPAPNGNNSTRYVGRYLRFLLDRFASDTDLRGGQIPNDYRMNVAREVAKDLVLNTPGMRFGLTHFNNNEGGTVAAVCGTDSASITSSIDALTAETWTPLGESLYEITRYFRGMQSYFNSGTYSSPIQYRCQKNFTVVITDGLPTYDGTYPSNDPDDPNGLLPNWDGVSNDGPGGNSSTEGDALYLDDIAKFGYDIDMRKGGNDAAGESFDDPRHPKQNMFTYTIGFTVQNEMLEDAAEYGDGLYLTANNADELKDKLGEALASIQARLGASSSAATSGGSVQVGASVYLARLNSGNWTGQLLSFAVDTDRASPGFGDVLRNVAGPDGSQWDAGARIANIGWSSRTIITNTAAGVGRPFRWADMTAAEQAAHFDSTPALLEYLRGRNVAAYRARPSLLGDIVNSSPQYVGAPSALYPPTLESASYLTFKKAQANRPAMVYVGANDGMLHGFDAQTGLERLAYIPGSLLGRLKVLADPEYNDTHRFFVDGSPTVVDAFINGSWRTVLVGGLNRGGQGIYALDVTNPTAFSEGVAASTFLWEFTDANDVDLGYTYSQPAIVKLQNGTWAAVFGNGYNNTIGDGRASGSGDAVLFIVNLQTGALIKKISTGVGVAEDPTGQNRPNGLASVAPVDVDGDYVVDYIYAGDLFGNMWKFDLSAQNTDPWSLDYKLFEACAGNACAAGNRQPITSRPTVIRHPTKAGEIVLFGTGKYLEQADNISLNGGVQSFYAIWDDGRSQDKPVARNTLQQQRIIFQGAVDFTTPDGDVTEQLRVTSSEAVNWNNQNGWYLNLVPPQGFEGERQITNPIVRNGKVIFTTMIPSDTSDPCAPAGTSWLMELDAARGRRLEYAPFDLNDDGRFTTDDFVTVMIDGKPVRLPPSGRKFEGGNAQTPAVMGDPAGNKEFKYVSTSEGLEVIVENQGRFATGRQSWIELY